MDVDQMLQQTNAIDAIADQLGVDRATAQAGATALLPQILSGFQNPAAAAEPQPALSGLGGLGGLLGTIGGLGGGALLDNVTSSQPTEVEKGSSARPVSSWPMAQQASGRRLSLNETMVSTLPNLTAGLAASSLGQAWLVQCSAGYSPTGAKNRAGAAAFSSARLRPQSSACPQRCSRSCRRFLDLQMIGVLVLCGTITGLITAVALTVLLPNELRGLSIGAFIAIAGLIGFGIAPTLVTAVSGILGGEQYLGEGLAIVGLVVSAISVFGFILAMRRAPLHATCPPGVAD